MRAVTPLRRRSRLGRAPAAIPIRKTTIGIPDPPAHIFTEDCDAQDVTGDRPELEPVNVGAAVIDIGSKLHMATLNLVV